MFKSKITGDFTDRMRRRADSWASKPTLSAAIVVPPELFWWKLQEFGSSELGAKMNYTITGNPDLVWEGPGGHVVKKQVNHPGIATATHMVGEVFEKANSTMKEDFSRLFHEAEYAPEAVRTAFIERYMENLKEQIVVSIAEKLSNVRRESIFPNQTGKLHGQTASEVFNEQARVEERE